MLLSNPGRSFSFRKCSLKITSGSSARSTKKITYLSDLFSLHSRNNTSEHLTTPRILRRAKRMLIG